MRVKAPHSYNRATITINGVWTRSYFFLRFSDCDGESKMSTRVGLEAEACTFQTKSNLFEIISAKLKKSEHSFCFSR